MKTWYYLNIFSEMNADIFRLKNAFQSQPSKQGLLLYDPISTSEQFVIHEQCLKSNVAVVVFMCKGRLIEVKFSIFEYIWYNTKC